MSNILGAHQNKEMLFLFPREKFLITKLQLLIPGAIHGLVF